MTLVRNSFANASDCVECMKEESVVWAQCGKNALATASGHFCSLECLRVWAIKQGLKR